MHNDTLPAPGFNARQVRQLLAPINRNRVLADGKGHSHVSQQDVTAHLIRVFGFGGFDVETIESALVFETPRDDNGKRWDVCYRARVRVTVRDEHGQQVAHYEDGSTATAQNQTRGDAHDLAMKSALSLAKKRATINLGDQFGLSLYNKGQTDALVIATLVRPEEPQEADTPDVQAGVPQQVAMGDDETGDQAPEPEPATRAARPAARQQGPTAVPKETEGGVDPAVLKAQTIAACTATDLATLKAAWDEAIRSGAVHVQIVDPDDQESTTPSVTLGAFITRRKGQIEADAA